MKVLKINSSYYDYGASAFEGCPLSVKDVVEQLSGKVDGEFEQYEFNAEIVEFDADLSDNDIKKLNSLVDTHFDKFFKIE